MLINTDKLKSIISAIKAYIKPPDYAQNDSTARDYIKNRPFYDTREVIKLFEFDSHSDDKTYKLLKLPDFDTNELDRVIYSCDSVTTNQKYTYILSWSESDFWFDDYSSDFNLPDGSYIEVVPKDEDVYSWYPLLFYYADEATMLAIKPEINNQIPDKYIPGWYMSCYYHDTLTGYSNKGELKKIDGKYLPPPDWSQNDPDGEGYIANRTHWREKVDELESTYDNLPVSINMLLWTTYDTQAITTMLGHYTTNNYLYNADWSNNPCPIMLYSVGGSSNVSTVLRMFISPLQNIKSVAVYNADGSLIGQATTDYTDIFKDKNGDTVTDNQGRTLYFGALVGTITLGSNSYDSGCTNYLYSIKIVQTDEYSYHPIDFNYFPDDIKYLDYNKSSATNLENGSGRYSLQQKSYGNQNNASGYGSFAIGENTIASGAESFASGQNSVASGTGSFASGGSKASAHYAHAEGCVTEASGRGAHSEGEYTTASGGNSHSEGNTTTASGNYSHAEGLETTAQRKSQHAQGEYNVLDTTGSTTTRGTYAHIVGNGTSDSKRSNAHTLDWSGNAWFAGDVYTRSTSGTNKDAGSKKLATEELVNTAQSTADEAKLAAADANTKAGNLDNLKTDAKDNLVEAINEAAKSGLPTVTTADDGKVLTVENGAWTAGEKPTYTAEEVGAIAQDDLQTATNAALAQAKASGEFDGYSPVRGTDYWTTSDIEAIKGYVDDAILNGSW